MGKIAYKLSSSILFKSLKCLEKQKNALNTNNHVFYLWLLVEAKQKILINNNRFEEMSNMRTDYIVGIYRFSK